MEYLSAVACAHLLCPLSRRIAALQTCSKGKKTETFYTQQEYENWRAEMNGVSRHPSWVAAGEILK